MSVFVVSQINFYPDYKRPEVYGKIIGVFKEGDTAYKTASDLFLKHLNERAEWNDDLYEALSGLDKSVSVESLYSSLSQINDEHGGDEESGFHWYADWRVDEVEVK